MVSGADTSVQLTAGAVATKVDVAAYAASGRRVDGTSLTVAATATQVWSPKKGADYVVVTPSTRRAAGPCTARSSTAGPGWPRYP